MLGEFFLTKKRVLKLMGNLFKSSDVVLDIGCGKSPYYHKSIKARIICTDIKHTEKADFVCDAASLPLKNGKLDGVISVNSLYYFSNPFECVGEFSRVLKKGGKLVIVVPFIYPIHDVPDDKYRFTEYGIREIFKNNFSIKEIKTIGGIFNLPAVFFHSLIKGIPLLAPKSLRNIVGFVSAIILYPAYIAAQLISILDFLDKTKRWPTYYFVVAVRK